MRTFNMLATACRHCRYYTPEGRRGGQCGQLGVPVQGQWKACSLAIPPFAPSWERIEEMVHWHQDVLEPQLAIAMQPLLEHLSREEDKFAKPLAVRESVSDHLMIS